MQEVGKQYSKDDKIDPSGFLKCARLHQSKFRAEVLGLSFDGYGNYLTKEDGATGKNFYDGFGILDAVRKYRGYNRPLYSNMLRSEHIPFNVFIPLGQNKAFCKKVLNDIFDNEIGSVDRLEIEYAPSPAKRYLNDRTSFDAYIEYTRTDNERGIVGIEVKYTEQAYRLKRESKEEKDILDRSSKYFTVTNDCKLFKPTSLELLPTDRFRQVWRNQLLGESILLMDNDKFKHFTSMTLYPQGNSHFVSTSKEYAALLETNPNRFLPITYEHLFSAYSKHCPDDEYAKWLSYLNRRYIVNGAS